MIRIRVWVRGRVMGVSEFGSGGEGEGKGKS